MPVDLSRRPATASAQDSSARDAGYARGVLLVVCAAIVWSSGGILVRSIEDATGWQIIFYRSLSLVLTLLAVLLARHRSRILHAFRAIGRIGVLGASIQACATSGFVFSLLNTTVANTLFIFSAAPFIASVLAWLVLKERLRRATWIAMAGALAGVGVMVGEGLGAGRMLGNLLALVTATGFACFAVILRYARGLDMLPMVCLSGTFAAVIAGSMADSLVISLTDLVFCALLGCVQVGLGMVLFVKGAQHVPAGELALLTMVEVVLGPIWVWLGVGEVPSPLTLLGGAVVLAAIAGNALSGMRRRPPPLGAV